MLDEITKGFKPIAVRDDRGSNSVISHNAEKKLFLISINGKLGGPFKMDELSALVDNLKDVIDMKGHHFLYIDEYDVRGNHIV